MLAGFLVFMGVFLLVGFLSSRRSDGSTGDYYLAGRSVSPMLVGLSAVATNNSGYMFIGIMGFTYVSGLSVVWLGVGLIFGDYLTSLFVHRRLRAVSQEQGALTFPSALAAWQGKEMRWLRLAASLLTLIFLGAYAAAQLSAGGKALEVLLNWPVEWGAMIAALMVASYCMVGGFRASIWTDAAQSTVMYAAMVLLMVVAIVSFGGIGASYTALNEIPDYLNWFAAGDLLVPGAFGAVLFVVGWMFAGACVIGQPHIMVRFMALDEEGRMGTARAWYYGFYTSFFAISIVVGLMTRLHLGDIGSMDPELVLPVMAVDLLPAFLVGLILAGIFAATMSTADSLLLSCAATLTHDLLPVRFERPAILRGATVAMTAFALAIALSGSQSVFSLVILAWSVLGASFGPLLILLALRRPVGEVQAIAMIIAGCTAVLVWRSYGLQGAVFEGLPGMVAAFFAYFASAPFIKPEKTAAASAD
jgi:sodium/proline symporter